MTTVRDALLARSEDHRAGLLAGDERWSWREYVEQCARRAHVVAALLDDDHPPHVGLLMDNTPEMTFQLGAHRRHHQAGSTARARPTARACSVAPPCRNSKRLAAVK